MGILVALVSRCPAPAGYLQHLHVGFYPAADTTDISRDMGRLSVSPAENQTQYLKKEQTGIQEPDYNIQSDDAGSDHRYSVYHNPLIPSAGDKVQ